MAKNYRTAQGKTVDMSALAAKNEKVRAVGINMKVNARGDTIDQHNKIVVPVTQKVGQKYQNTVGNKSAQTKAEPVAKQIKPKVTEEVYTADELELEQEVNDDEEVLKVIKKQEDNK